MRKYCRIQFRIIWKWSGWRWEHQERQAKDENNSWADDDDDHKCKHGKVDLNKICGTE